MIIPTRLNKIVGSFTILVLLFLSCAIDVTLVSAVSIVVDTTNDEEIDDEICSLREAIQAAKNHADFYGCVGGASAYITLPTGTYTVEDTEGLGQLPSINTEITINGANATSTIIQASSCNPTQEVCTNDHELFWVNSSGTLNLNNLTIRNGQNISDLNGGVIYNGGTLNVTNSVLIANKSIYGGSILNDGDLYIGNSTISSNVAQNNGGAIYNANGHNLEIEKSTFSGNSAVWGGAIFSVGNLEITNSTFSGNSATNNGGAIFEHSNCIGTVINSTFSENAATNGGGIYLDGTLNFTNTIIANSTAGGDCTDSGSIGTNVNNLVGDGTCSSIYSGDPSLGILANYGGLTKTHSLLEGSIAIDAGNLAGCPDTDQRGVERPQLSGCDIGAYEKEPITSIYLPIILK